MLSRIIELGTQPTGSVSKTAYLDHLRELRAHYDNPPPRLLIQPGLFWRIPALIDQAIHALELNLPGQIACSNVHTDFNGRNLFFRNSQISLVYDWESYRPASLHEHIASIIGRMCTDRPLQGSLDWDKVQVFIDSLSPSLRAFLLNTPDFSTRFPYLAALGHLRLLLFRHLALQHNNRPDLTQSLLVWPIHYCDWLIGNAAEVTQKLDARLHITRINAPSS